MANLAEGVTVKDACKIIEEASKELDKGFGFEWRRAPQH